jgi:hypothetical protein
MTTQERADAVARLGFTERQARFLVTVMTHSGVCLPRQYTAFAGIVYGQKTRRFFGKVIADGHASTCRCLHNRALVYHVHGGALYRAVGEPHSRLRRPVPPAAVVPRLMLLDAVLASPGTTWLADDGARRSHLRVAASRPFDSGAQSFTDDSALEILAQVRGTVSVGLEAAGNVALVHVITTWSLASLRSLLRRLRPVLNAWPSARIRIVYPADLQPAWEAREGAAPPVSEAFRVQLQTAAGAAAERIEFQPLPHSYRHLLPLAAGGRIPDLVAVQGEQVGEQRSARSRPRSQRLPSTLTPAREIPPRAAFNAASSLHSPTGSRQPAWGRAAQFAALEKSAVGRCGRSGRERPGHPRHPDSAPPGSLTPSLSVVVSLIEIARPFHVGTVTRSSRLAAHIPKRKPPAFAPGNQATLPTWSTVLKRDMQAAMTATWCATAFLARGRRRSDMPSCASARPRQGFARSARRCAALT